MTRTLRIAVVWDARTQWLGGWNYFLNMVRVTRAFSLPVQFVLFSSSDLSEKLVRQAVDAAIEPALTLPPFRRFTHPWVLLGARHGALDAALSAAHVDLVFEMTNYLGPLSTRVLSWIPDVQHHVLPHLFSRRERYQRNLEFRRRLTNRAHVMLSSHSAYHDIQAFMPRPKAQLHVVPFAIRPTMAIDDAAIAAAQNTHGLTPGYIYLPNQFWQHKNHVLALEALALAVEGGADIRLVLSGQALDSRDGRYPQRLAELMERPSVARHVRMLGVIPYPDLLALIAGSRALLNPSLFEGWSSTVEEAKALGARMVLSDLPVHREQAEGRAIFFDRHSNRDAARALTEAARLPIAPDPDRRTAATAENADAQRIYAERLMAVFQTTVSG